MPDPPLPHTSTLLRCPRGAQRPRVHKAISRANLPQPPRAQIKSQSHLHTHVTPMEWVRVSALPLPRSLSPATVSLHSKPRRLLHLDLPPPPLMHTSTMVLGNALWASSKGCYGWAALCPSFCIYQQWRFLWWTQAFFHTLPASAFTTLQPPEAACVKSTPIVSLGPSSKVQAPAPSPGSAQWLASWARDGMDPLCWFLSTVSAKGLLLSPLSF